LQLQLRLPNIIHLKQHAGKMPKCRRCSLLLCQVEIYDPQAKSLTDQKKPKKEGEKGEQPPQQLQRMQLHGATMSTVDGVRKGLSVPPMAAIYVQKYC